MKRYLELNTINRVSSYLEVGYIRLYLLLKKRVGLQLKHLGVP